MISSVNQINHSAYQIFSLLGRLLGFICTSSQLSVTDGGEVFERHKSMNFSLQCASRDIFTLMGHVLPTSLLLEKKKKIQLKLDTSCSYFFRHQFIPPSKEFQY